MYHLQEDREIVDLYMNFDQIPPPSQQTDRLILLSIEESAMERVPVPEGFVSVDRVIMVTSQSGNYIFLNYCERQNVSKILADE